MSELLFKHGSWDYYSDGSIIRRDSLDRHMGDWQWKVVSGVLYWASDHSEGWTEDYTAQHAYEQYISKVVADMITDGEANEQ